MDPAEKSPGFDESNFWHKAKVVLIKNLITKAIGQRAHGAKPDILVIGCGTGNDLDVISKFGKRVVVCDTDKEAIKGIKAKVVKRHMDARNLEFKDGSFDIVLAFDVLEHIKEDKLAIKEAFRVLRKGGCFVLTVPACKLLYSNYDRYYKHFRRYNRKELSDKLCRFEAVYIGYWNAVLFFPFSLERVAKKFLKHKPYRTGVPSFLNNFF